MTSEKIPTWKKKGFESQSDYQEHLVKKKGFESRSVYEEHMAKKRGFESRSDYMGHLVKKKGFESQSEYQDYLARERGFESQSDYDKYMRKKKMCRVLQDMASKTDDPESLFSNVEFVRDITGCNIPVKKKHEDK